MLTQYQPLISRGAVELILSSRVNSVKKNQIRESMYQELDFYEGMKS